ncbi:hypothetical protein AOQ84DRAFT_44149 [Glonium stellatum]|uniref:dolichol kinase n=1 Tax=Glonium stellatum TaxID=574774 RepID=A0A8E2F0Z4_9PEZI|nr:hypothetical protein AOQ84DRAFT_44149 [Glonium stellatum]
MSTDLKSPEPPDTRSEQGDASDVDALGLLRRSPHPYHRRQPELRSINQSSESSSNDFVQQYALTSSKPGSDRDRTISDDDARTRRKASRTPSDSGTEADDEGYSFVRALPAPPIRPRKGLRDLRGSGPDAGASPLLTPSQVDEEGRKFLPEYFKSSKEGFDGPSPTDEEARAARQKYLKRRRAELIRRTTETGLLGIVGLLAINGCSSRKILQWHRVELVSHIMVFCTLVLFYPLRLLNYSRQNSTTPNRRLRQRIRIPVAFDPAPILYPVFIPVLVSLSLLPTFQRVLLPNVILSLATLPSQLIPHAGCGNGFCTGHWFISIIPLIASQNTEWPSKLFPPKPYMLKTPPPEGLDPEVLVSLFALHQTLLPPLHYLTTTSLLPAELHLLSISLINVLLLAESPQMVILATLIWLGSLGLFVSCGQILKWGVALARIPRWRFRRAGQIIKARQSFIQVLNNGLKNRRVLGINRRRDVPESDADDDPVLVNNHRKRKGSLRLDILDSARRAFPATNDAETRSAVEQSRTNPFPAHEEINDAKTSTRKRRNTLPNLGEAHVMSRHTSATRHKRSKSSIAQSFLSLTPTQAAVRKWLYAGYVYLIMLTLTLGPIRYFIGKYALHGCEPFGWAVGYLFGNIQPMRFWIINWDLEQWIALPPMRDPAESPRANSLGRAEYLRRYIIGEANTRLLLCGYCVTILGIGMAVVLRLSSFVEVDTRRKVFHGMMVAMLLPTIYVDPAFVALALVLVLSIFLLLDLLRASQLPPLSKPLAYFLTPYVDGRDLKGPVVISHIFLLIGCATPLWLSLAGISRTGARPWEGWEVASRDVSMVAGVVCVGMGDAAASLIGRRYGRHKWPWAGGKSLEGSVAFAIAVTLGLAFGKAWLSFGQWDDNGVGDSWALTLAKAAFSACGASLNEAVLTGGNDNVIVPVVLWLLVRGVRL